jgi:hypothetical protein
MFLFANELFLERTVMKKVRWISLFLVVASTGCSSENTEKQVTEITSDTDYFRQMTDLYCESQRGCCEEDKKVFSATSCVSKVRDLFETKANIPRKHGLSFDGPKAVACLEAFRESKAGYVCSQAFDLDERLPSCMQPYIGNKKTGQSCEDSSECAPSSEGTTYCHSSGMGKGQCVVVKAKGTEGQSCSPDASSMYDCDFQQGFYCNYASQKCAKVLPVGSSCSNSVECGFPLATCVGKGDDQAVCKKLAAIGENCDPKAAEIECLPEAFCNQKTAQCSPWKDLGQPCEQDRECRTYLCDPESKSCASHRRFNQYCTEPSISK